MVANPILTLQDLWKAILLPVSIMTGGLFLRVAYITFFGPLSHVPGPLATRFMDLPMKRATLKGRKMYYLHELHKKYGPIVRVSPTEASVVDLAATREIHKITGGLQEDGVEHSARRRLLGQPLSESALKVVQPLVHERLQLAIEKMKRQLQEAGYMDVYKWFHYMSADIISDLSFGQSFSLLEAGEDNQYIKDLSKNDAYSAYVFELSFLFKLLKLWPFTLPIQRELEETPKRLLSYAKIALDKYYHNQLQGGRLTPMLFSKLFKARDAGGLTEQEMIAEAASNILGGGETVAVTLAYLIWAVSRSPSVQARLREELAAVPDDFTYEHVRSLPYLGMVLDESMRLYNTVVGGSLRRSVPEGGRQLAGYYIQQGTTVAILQYSLQRDGAIFKDPEAFRPERWETPTQEMKDAFLPYGLGTRSCVGMHLANMELRISAVRFFKVFPSIVMSSAEGMSDDDMEMMNFFLVAPKGHRCLISVPSLVDK
ncbi:cytochrome P450 [Apiospora rasikravindrae]|uniref:Cytochrome P450 n=1 Tax=Apiospora rasikravindrae TaxID=990691 RepID=A0ABR1RSG4_9PEZI